MRQLGSRCGMRRRAQEPRHGHRVRGRSLAFRFARGPLTLELGDPLGVAEGSVKGRTMLLSINGLQPAKISSNVLRILPGSCASADGKFEIILRAPIDIDMRRVGFDGLDTGQIVEGGAYFPYLVRNRTSGEIGGVLSHSRFYGSPTESVVVPAGCQILRKLRFGFRYRAAWGGIPDFHYDHGAFVLLTEKLAASRIGMPHMQSGGAWPAFRWPI